VIDTSVAEDAYLALRVQDLPISLGNMRDFNIDLLKILKIYKLEKYIQTPTLYIYTMSGKHFLQLIIRMILNLPLRIVLLLHASWKLILH